jgi:Na+/H+ antiporter NhaC
MSNTVLVALVIAVILWMGGDVPPSANGWMLFATAVALLFDGLNLADTIKWLREKK